MSEPTRDDYFQAIGEVALEIAGEGAGKILIYAEVEDGQVAADLYFSSTPDVQFRFPTPVLEELILGFWDHERWREGGHEWRTLAFVIEDERFAVDLQFPEQLEPDEDIHDRRPGVLDKHFAGRTIDYSNPG